MSIEQSQDFHLVRRILKSVAPEYCILATPHLKEKETALDLVGKKIEIGEGTEIKTAVASALFQIGHLMVGKNIEFNLFCGKGFDKWNKSEESLIDKLSDLGVKADKEACDWAHKTFLSYWSTDEKEIKDLIGQYCWTKEEWVDYFGQNVH